MADDIWTVLGYGQAPQAKGLDVKKEDFTVSPNEAYNREALAGMMRDAQNRQAPTATAANIDRSDLQFRQGQSDLVNSLTGAANGTSGPSLAQTLLREGTDAAIKKSGGLLTAQPGLNPALAARLASENATAMGSNAAVEAAKLKAAEMAQARGELANVLGTARATDIGVNQAQAGFNQQAGLANQQAQLDQQKISDLAQQYAMSGMMTLDQAKAKATQDYYQMMADQNLQIQALNQKSYEDAEKRRSGGLMGAVGTAAGALALMSDEKQKKQIRPADALMEQFLNKMLEKL